MKIKFAYGIAAGAVSGGRKAKRRDNIRTAFENGVAVIFLSGSAAGIAAELTAERFDELYASESGFIKETLSGKKTDGALLFAAVKGNRYLAGQMGDGLIVSLGGGCTALSGPEPGSADELSIYRGEVKEPFGFMLISGAACRSLYEADTGNLSPACGTFFEWLKEYDEETVSEALLDNINKYFLKDVKGDIGVGMMVSAEDEEEPEALPETVEPETELHETTLPTEEPSDNAPLGERHTAVSGRSRNRSIIKYLIGALVVVAVLFVFAMRPELPMIDSGDAKPPTADTAEEPAGEPGSESSTDEPERGQSSAADMDQEQDLILKDGEPSVTFSVEDPVSYDAGEYQVGEDIPAGEYFFWTGDMLKPDSIKVNDVTCLSGELYCMTVEVDEGDTLNTEVRFMAADNVDPVKSEDGTLISGKYKIGKDIEPGTYKISPIDQNAKGKYYSILDGEISNDDAFGGGTTVIVPEKGYIVFYNAILTVE